MNRHLVIASTLFLLVSCTSPGEKTGVGAATGGAIGAGLGAIVGSQTGSAGGGLAIGTVAGAATGALIANAFEAQDETIRSQDEAIERQEQRLAAQSNEIRELRRIGSDSPLAPAAAVNPAHRAPTYGEPIKLRPPAKKSIALAPTVTTSQSTTSPVISTSKRAASTDIEAPRARPGSGVFERDIAPQPALPSDASANEGSLERAREIDAARTAALITAGEGSGESVPSEDSAPQDAGTEIVSTISDTAEQSPECRQAHDEGLAAERASATADKLYHYRRALRLCPGSAAFHAGLGEVYLSMNRPSDAEFELKEALRIDPQFAHAAELLQRSRQY